MLAHNLTGDADQLAPLFHQFDANQDGRFTELSLPPRPKDATGFAGTRQQRRFVGFLSCSIFQRVHTSVQVTTLSDVADAPFTAIADLLADPGADGAISLVKRCSPPARSRAYGWIRSQRNDPPG